MSFFRSSRLTRLAVLAAAFLCARSAAAGPDVVSVPDLVGAPRAEAEATLATQGLMVATFEVAGTPPGTVASQSPAAGTSLPRGATVIIDVRRESSDSTPAPNAVGLSPSEASLAFGSNYALRFESVAGPAAKKGQIVSQLPAMGQPLEIRGLLVLRFVPDDTLPAKVVMPDTLGLPTADAVKTIGDTGLHARVATTVLSGAPPDVVVAQWPLAGAEFDRYATVDIIVTVAGGAAAEPPAEATVPAPNCANLTESSARAALDAVGLTAEVEWIAGPAAEAFLVQSQDPAAGTPLPPGAAVHLTIVKYSAPVPPSGSQVGIPDLLGMTLSQAEDVLTALGLWASPILVVDPSAVPLHVVAQQLAPGTLVDAGSTVWFRIARPAPPGFPVPVPDFYGRTKSQSIGLAALAGLSLDILDVVNPSKPAHRVFSQNYAAFSVVPVGTLVTVKAAKSTGGLGSATIPDLTGMTESQALSALSTVGLAGSASWVVAPGKPYFKVYWQWPLAGGSAPVGSLVSFKVSKVPVGWKTVPNVLGMTKAHAITEVLAAGLVPVPLEVFAPAETPGHVFHQDPNGGVLRPGGSPVEFKVAKVIMAPVPDVGGKTKLQAEADLVAAGFSVNVHVQALLGKPAGRVWDQDPNAGALALPGTVVLIRVQPGAASVLVPFLFGLTGPQANAALTAAGLVPSETDLFSPAKPLWKVYLQNPLGGSLAASGSTVHFRVCVPLLPPAMTTVPNLNGMTGPGAQATLTGVGLVGAPGNFVTGLHPPGLVFWQLPAAGSGVSTGSIVNYKIAVAPPAPLVLVPNLIGRNASQAASDLAGVGLVSDGSIVLNLLKPLHKVYSQNYAPGTLVPSGTTVKWKCNP